MSSISIDKPRTCAEEIRTWFFDVYVPTWVGVGASQAKDDSVILEYWGRPLYAASVNMTRCLMSAEEVISLLRANHVPLQKEGYTHTVVLDRKIVGYNASAGSIDAIWSRRRADESEIERRAVHFGIYRTPDGWRVVSIASVHTELESLSDIWETLQ